MLEKVNLCKLAYHIEKGDIDTTKVVTMKDLLEGGVISKCKYGVKLMSKGAHKFKALGIPLNIEVSDAT